jgi:hypothetical protein
MLLRQVMSNSSPVTDCSGLTPEIAVPVPDGAAGKQFSGLRSCLGHASWQGRKRLAVWTFRASMLHQEVLFYLPEELLGANVSQPTRSANASGLLEGLTGSFPSRMLENTVN